MVALTWPQAPVSHLLAMHHPFCAAGPAPEPPPSLPPFCAFLSVLKFMNPGFTSAPNKSIKSRPHSCERCLSQPGLYRHLVVCAQTPPAPPFTCTVTPKPRRVPVLGFHNSEQTCVTPRSCQLNKETPQIPFHPALLLRYL